jgi:cystathionine beta-synthase
LLGGVHLELHYSEDVLATIGNTPLVKLNKIVEKSKPLILAKLEFMNPGGSVKDRIGVAMIDEAIQSGKIRPGGTIVEPTSGNTGVGLAIACIIRGLKLVATISDKMSLEKRKLLEAYGAKVIVCPASAKPEDPESYLSVAKKIASEMPNAFMPNQYSNMANPKAHYATTGKEIWEQTEGKITHFVAGLGTGGTISGVAKYLKEKNPDVKIIGVDPKGSVFKDIYDGKEPKSEAYMIEGIGEDFLPKTADLKLLDEIVTVSDKASYLMARRLATEEALLVGSSSGAAVLGALEIAKKLTKKHVIVTLLPDRGERYLSKLFNDEWMKEKNFI